MVEVNFRASNSPVIGMADAAGGPPQFSCSQVFTICVVCMLLRPKMSILSNKTGKNANNHESKSRTRELESGAQWETVHPKIQKQAIFLARNF